MKIEVNIDPKDLAIELSKEIVNSLKPTLNVRAISRDDKLFTVKTLAEYLGVSDQWVYERVQKHEVPFIKLGKFPRFKKSDIEKWLESLATPAMNPLSRKLAKSS